MQTENWAYHQILISSLFIPSLKKKTHFAQMVPITDGKLVMLQLSQYKSIVVKPTKIPHFCIPHCPGIVFWDNSAGRTTAKASTQTAIFRMQKTTFPSTRNVFLLTILNELGDFYMHMCLNLWFQAGITRGNTDWRSIWKTCIYETLAVMNYWTWQ